jgi:hypothetical protein
VVRQGRCVRGLYVGKYPPKGGISADVIWGKNIKREEKKGENVTEKGRKGRKGKENEKKKGKKKGKINAK